MHLSPFVFLAASSVLTAQGSGDRAIVLSRSPAPAVASLLDVDLTTGTVTALGRFSLDTFLPLAVAIDSVNRDVVVALQTPVGSSILVRLRVAGTAVVPQGTLGDVPGVVSSLTQAMNGKWITTTDAGVYATERNGSVARLIAALPLASALEAFGLGSFQAVVAQSGSAAADPQVRWLDLTNGQTIAGPWVYTGHLPRGITGVGDLPTGLSRQILSQDDGTVAMSVNFANPVPLPLQPALPPGATEAMRMRGLEGVVLGGSAHPFLKGFQALGGTQWTMLAGPLPGDPVDFGFRPAVAAATVEFGDACGTMRLDEDPSGGPPRVGNASYGVRLTHGTASSPAFLLLGGSDQRFATLRLPAVLPGGCLALCSADLVLATATDAFGAASLTLGVPNVPSLAGGIAFVQWLQVRGGAIDSSNGGAVWVAP